MIKIFIITTFLVIVAIGIIVLVLVYQKKQLQYIGEKKQLKDTYEKEILESKLEIQEQTLKYISQEIHDNIGQALSLVKLNINTMNHGEPELLQNKIVDSRQLITKVIQDLRDLSRTLNTDYIMESGLLKVIEYELGMIKKSGVFEVVLETQGDEYRLENQQELILFRIVQESINNIIKHSRATTISIRVLYEPHLFTLIIKDNGVGFDASQLENNNYNKFGLGLRNMLSRANIINASFKLTSTINEGTFITLTLPLGTAKL